MDAATGLHGRRFRVAHSLPPLCAVSGWLIGELRGCDGGRAVSCAMSLRRGDAELGLAQGCRDNGSHAAMMPTRGGRVAFCG